MRVKSEHRIILLLRRNDRFNRVRCGEVVPVSASAEVADGSEEPCILQDGRLKKEAERSRIFVFGFTMSDVDTGIRRIYTGGYSVTVADGTITRNRKTMRGQHCRDHSER